MRYTRAAWPCSATASRLAALQYRPTQLNGCFTAARDMQDKFEAAGYKLPQVVYWNLRASCIRGQKSTPVTYDQEGVALVSGFSGQLLKLFMDQPNDLTAWEV